MFLMLNIDKKVYIYFYFRHFSFFIQFNDVWFDKTNLYVFFFIPNSKRKKKTNQFNNFPFDITFRNEWESKKKNQER